MKKEDIRLNDTVYYVFVEFDGRGCQKCTVIDILEDHIILHDDELNINYWIDDDRLGCISTVPVVFL